MTTDEHTFTVDDQLPSLVINYPTCGHCDKDVRIEDGTAFCENCRIEWDDISEDATATPDPNEEGSEVPCEIVLGEHARPEYDYNGKHWSLSPKRPCILPSGHEGDHLNPHTVTTTPLTKG